jgi:hypothetical protein
LIRPSTCMKRGRCRRKFEDHELPVLNSAVQRELR